MVGVLEAFSLTKSARLGCLRLRLSNKISSGSSLIALGVALVIPGSAVAQADSAQEGVAAVAEQSEDDAARFGEVIMVTAERRTTNIQSTPLSIVAVTEERCRPRALRIWLILPNSPRV